MSLTDFSAVPKPALGLTLAGVLPFAAGALGVLVLSEVWAAEARTLLIGYGAVILSFLGGCRWGLAAAGAGRGPDLAALAISVVPPLVAWVAVLLPAPADALLMAGAFTVLLVADIGLARDGGAPAWWPALRTPPSIAAILAMLAAAV